MKTNHQCFPNTERPQPQINHHLNIWILRPGFLKRKLPLGNICWKQRTGLCSEKNRTIDLCLWLVADHQRRFNAAAPLDNVMWSCAGESRQNPEHTRKTCEPRLCNKIWFHAQWTDLSLFLFSSLSLSAFLLMSPECRQHLVSYWIASS